MSLVTRRAGRPPSTTSTKRGRAMLVGFLAGCVALVPIIVKSGLLGEGEPVRGRFTTLAAGDAVGRRLTTDTTAAPPPTPPPPPPTTAPPPPPTTVPHTHPPTTAPPLPSAPAPSGNAALDAIQQYFPDSYGAAVRVARCESGLNPRAVSSGGGNWGLFQINTVHRRRVASMGYSWDQILDPYVNSHVARSIYNEQGWGPWSCKP